MNNEDIVIRDFGPTDFDGCAELVDKVWEFHNHFSPQQLAEFFKRLYTGGSLSESNVNKVVEEKGKVVGFLFGKIAGLKTYKNEFSGFGGQFRVLRKLLFMKGVAFKRKMFYLKIINTHELNRRAVEPRDGSEVNLFVVYPGTQGKGYGKRLLFEFIAACKEHHVESIVLETDNESNHGFYTHLGFTVKSSFFSPILKEYSRGSGETFIYEMKL
jgi:ribosomal protein S18 acetylase RimI-like enzyme